MPSRKGLISSIRQRCMRFRQILRRTVKPKKSSVVGSKKQKKREDIILASKIAGPALPWIRGGQYTIDRKNILEALDGSLKRLQSDYIDLYQLHWPNRGSYHFGQQWDYTPSFDKAAVEDNFMDVLRTLDEQILAGKIRHIGLSNETAWGIMKWLRLSEDNGLPRMASVQNEYSLLCRQFDTDLHEIAVHEDIGLLAWSPLGGGMLSGKYLDGARPKGTRWDIEERFLQRDTQTANDAIKAYITVSEKHGLDVCQMALAFVNNRPHVTSNIIGATTMEQLKNNISSIDISLSAECYKDIEAVYRKYPMVF